ncbi:MAG: hypothetical protein M0Q53_09895 [Prolixibacteraceae bacterium]|jgi:hypothetical protein|nr:hypothetical protein [Prolixibacteraceae bacterium]
MDRKNFTRRDFIGKSTAGLAGAIVSTSISSCSVSSYISGNYGGKGDKYSTGSFASEVERLPLEAPYDYHKRLSTSPVHIIRRYKEARLLEGEMFIPVKGWKIKWNQGSSVIIQNAVDDFQDYLDKSQGVKVDVEDQNSLEDYRDYRQNIVVGTREQLPGFGLTLKAPKDYEIVATPEQIIVCGYDERGAMFGLYNLEARMNLREAPFLPNNLKTVRHSLYDTRMVLSWMGWMEWPDQLLSHLVHDGFDGIFASVYANPNGEGVRGGSSRNNLSAERDMNFAAKIRDLINRATRFGIKVYTPIIYQYQGTPESELGLRKLVRDIVKEFPDIKGYILLTEGFEYKTLTFSNGKTKEFMDDWIKNWTRAVAIVEEECHQLDPSIEVLPWEYNIDFRPQNTKMKVNIVSQLPVTTIPLVTWENGASFKLDGMTGYLRDYALNAIGPAEVTEAMISETKRRGMKIYSKADTMASWQYGSTPYLPCPNQWYKRYQLMEKYGVNGTLESWSSGYTPNFIGELRAWTCWSDAPVMQELFSAIAARIFGKEQKETVIKAWEYFSQAISLVPDTGPNMGTVSAIGNPLFFQESPVRVSTRNYSWGSRSQNNQSNIYWPYTIPRLIFYPDFTNQTNCAEQYARSATAVQLEGDTKFLPLFLKYLKLASDQMEEGLKLYRAAAYRSPESKRQLAVKEVVVAEQMHRMMKSDHAILEFEDLRLKWVKEQDILKAGEILDKMENIVRDEINQTELSLLAATRDSRLGFQFEQDYVYTPYSLTEKIRVLNETLKTQLPTARKRKFKSK